MTQSQRCCSSYDDSLHSTKLETSVVDGNTKYANRLEYVFKKFSNRPRTEG